MKIADKEAKLLQVFAEKGISNEVVKSFSNLCHGEGYVESTLDMQETFKRYYSNLIEATNLMDKAMNCSSLKDASPLNFEALEKLEILGAHLRNEIRFCRHISRIEE